jgi:hypothetical protein
MSRRVLVSFAGMRDPVVDGPEKIEEFLKPDSLDPERFDRQSLRKLHSSSNLGPICTALMAFGKAWSPDEVYVLYVPSDEMNRRVGALCQLLPAITRLQGRDSRVTASELEIDNVADYGLVWNRAKSVLRTLIASADDIDCRLLVGPGTPQMVVATILMPYADMRGAQLWQVMDPKKVHEAMAKRKIESAGPMYAKCLEFGTDLPILTVEGMEADVVADLRKRIAELENEVKLLRMHPAAPRQETAAPQWKEYKSAERRRVCENAVRLERQAALKEGRKPSMERAAKPLGLTRQAFAKALKSLGIDW